MRFLRWAAATVGIAVAMFFARLLLSLGRFAIGAAIASFIFWGVGALATQRIDYATWDHFKVIFGLAVFLSILSAGKRARRSA